MRKLLAKNCLYVKYYCSVVPLLQTRPTHALVIASALDRRDNCYFSRSHSALYGVISWFDVDVRCRQPRV